MSDDGIELCRRLRQDTELRFVPIIMISAFHSVSDRIKALKLGVADYLPQPVEPEEMLARLENHIQFQQYRKQLEQENHQLQASLRPSSGPSRAALLAQVVLNQSSDYLLFIQSNNTITYANESACALLGYGPDELLNTPIDTLDVGLAPQDWETIWEHLRTHTALSLNSVHITKSGDILDVLLDLQYLQVQGEEFSYIAAKRASAIVNSKLAQVSSGRLGSMM
ncbi:MAG: response regulator [Synechococcales cyanobacterium CRU_2_2]|nr:response regulator [Synechococcales cyanobacterium CRU_2_2]